MKITGVQSRNIECIVVGILLKVSNYAPVFDYMTLPYGVWR